MTLAYIDQVGGVAGDMLLAALVDAGAPADAIVQGLAGLGLAGYQLRFERTEAHGPMATRALVTLEAEEEDHRHLGDILEILGAGALPPRVRGRAERVFRALAEAEAQVHGTTVEEVHFHEVGALDAIVDVVGVCLGLELLGVAQLEASPFPLAPGQVTSAHGVIPLPAPAVLRLIASRRAPVVGRLEGGELVTPTGAALLVGLAERFGAWPPLALEAVGYGAGTRLAPEGAPPNVVRVALGQRQGGAGGAEGEVWVLEANVDDETPEASAYIADRLREAGALEVFLTPVQMKKGRPGLLLTALCGEARVGLVEDVLLRESATLGVRRRREQRTTLPRRLVTVETPFGPVRVKLADRPGGASAAPEYEDCARAAREAGVPLRAVFAAAHHAARTIDR